MYKGDNFCNFLFPFLHLQIPSEKGLLKKERIYCLSEKGLLIKERICSLWEHFTFRVDLFFRKEANKFNRVAFLENVSILKLRIGRSG